MSSAVEDEVEEFLDQNPDLRQWVESLRGTCETQKQWNARRTFLLRNLDQTRPQTLSGHVPQPGPDLDRLLAQSMVWSNHVFMGCRYPQAVMDKVLPMSEGIEVQDAPQFTTRDQIMRGGKRGSDLGPESGSKRTKTEESGPQAQKSGPSAQAPYQLQPFFNRLYKAVCWRLVSAGGLGGPAGTQSPGPNLDHWEVLKRCVESCKDSLGCVMVPLKEIAGLPAGRTQDGHVCELRCQGVYLGTGYGRDEAAARAMASKEALKVFQGRKVLVKICRRKFRGSEVEDLVLLDDQPRNQGFPPALSHPFSPSQDCPAREETAS
ncbi:unnamed protein product [Knipowitschia caucasica]